MNSEVQEELNRRKRVGEIHPKYGQPKSNRPTPGEYLGSNAQSERMKRGDIVVAVTGKSHMSDYYYDPALRIEGEHFAYRGDGKGWVRLNYNPEVK